MTNLYALFVEMYSHNPVLRDRFLNSLLLLLVIWVLRRISLLIIDRSTDDPRHLYTWKKTTGYAAFVIAFFFIGQIWLTGLEHLGTFLGLMSAGIAIALKDPIIDMAGWLFILWRKPFTVGDRVQVGEQAGDIIDLRVFQFSLLEIGNWVHADQSTGRIVHVPNSYVFTHTVANYTIDFPYIWNEVSIMVTFESNWEKARDLIRDTCYEYLEQYVSEAEKYVGSSKKKWYIIYSALTPITYTRVEDSGVTLTVRYICPPKKRRSTESLLWETILKTFKEHEDIDFAYPTIRYYSHLNEPGEAK